MPRTVVTGGAGFLGSHLCDRFLAEGHEVVCVDNLISGNLANLEHLNGNRRFSYIEHDISQSLVLDGSVDNVLHFASPASPVDYLRYPIPTLKVGSLGTHNMLGLAKLKNARFLLASTSEVYGDPEQHPQREDYWGNVNPIGPRACYDESKRLGETLTMEYYRQFQLNARIVRIFNTYGPNSQINDGRMIPNFITQALKNEPLTVYGDGSRTRSICYTRICRIFNTYGERMRLDDGRVLPNLMGQALRGEALTIYGDGSQTRSFCYVSDLIDGIFRLLHADFHEPVNLGNPNEVSILDFAREIRTITGSKSALAFKPLPQDDPKVRRPDIERARRLLGWEPKVNRQEGLRRTLAHFQASIRVKKT